MKTFYSPIHLGHDPLAQFEGGMLSPAVEIPVRAEIYTIGGLSAHADQADGVHEQLRRLRRDPIQSQ